MTQPDHIIVEALEYILATSIPDEYLADAINNQVRLMSGVDHDEYLDTLIDIIN
jgi:hypothetical protein